MSPMFRNPHWLQRGNVSNPGELAHRPEQPDQRQTHGGLVAGKFNNTPWTNISDSPVQGVDCAAIHVGSIARTIAHYIEAVHIQGLQNNNLATDTGLTITKADGEAVAKRLRTAPDTIKLSIREGSDVYSQIHQNQAVHPGT